MEKGDNKKKNNLHTTVSINLGMFYVNLSFGIWMVEIQNTKKNNQEINEMDYGTSFSLFFFKKRFLGNLKYF